VKSPSSKIALQLFLISTAKPLVEMTGPAATAEKPRALRAAPAIQAMCWLSGTTTASWAA
jgi:hypothetical protein